MKIIVDKNKKNEGGRTSNVSSIEIILTTKKESK